MAVLTGASPTIARTRAVVALTAAMAGDSIARKVRWQSPTTTGTQPHATSQCCSGCEMPGDAPAER